MIVHSAVKATILSSLLFVNAHANMVAVDVKKEDETASVPDTSQSLKEAKMDASTNADGNYVEDAFSNLGEDWEYDVAKEDHYRVEEDMKDLEWNEGEDEDGNVAIYIDPASYKAKYFNVEEDINPGEVLDLSALKNGSLRHRKLVVVTAAAVGVTAAVVTAAVAVAALIDKNSNPGLDDANLYVTIGDTKWAGGNSMGIAYHLVNGRRDNDGLHDYARGETKGSREDLENENLKYVELYLHRSGDICINHLLLKVGPQPSGTGKTEMISIPSWLIANISGASYSKYYNDGVCVWFGHNERNLANFKFNWEKARSCYQQYGKNNDVTNAERYMKCFKGAMVQHDLYYDSGIKRKYWTENTAIPTPMVFSFPPPPKWINLKQSGLCAGIDLSLKSDNGAGIYLQECSGFKAQQWNYDSLGRLVNRFSGKCMEFGNKDVLYARAFQYTCHTGKHQQWDQLSNGKYRNKAFRSKFLGVAYCGQRSDKRRIEAKNYVGNGGVCDCAQSWNKGGTCATSTTTNYPCGCGTCNQAALSNLAGAYSCGARIDWLRSAAGGSLSERDACIAVGGNEFPSECGKCDPNKCS